MRTCYTTEMLLDVLHECIDVDLPEEMIVKSKREENSITVTLSDGSDYMLSVNKVSPKTVINVVF